VIIVLTVSRLDSQTFDVLKYNWRAREDSLWGTIPAQAELRAFDSVWTLIDQRFACFQNLNLDWTAIRSKYRPEIQLGVSRGRFAAILSQMSLALMEPHTHIGDLGITNLSKGTPGLPMVFVGTNDGSFGAGLTPLADSTVLVYKAIPSHPLGLEPGDIVLGYDGIPWKELYPRLIKMELPISFTSYWGGTTDAFEHSWLQSAGRNWQLFDTIDVLKYSTKDTLHFPTSLLVGKNLNLFCTEQLPVPGIPMVDSINPNKDVRWGIVQGTNIGYVYVWTWFYNTGRFYDAIDSLTRVHNVDGIVIDLRQNYGGYVPIADEAFRLLFKVAPPPIYLGSRDNPFDHFSMGTYSQFSFSPDTTRFFDKPIAMLMGPNSVSANDFIATQLRNYPKARFFGESPAAGYASDVTAPIDSFCFAQYSWLNGYVLQDSVQHYLTHVEFPMDGRVWLTQDGVAKGQDDVALAALNWIETATGVRPPAIAEVPTVFTLSQNYPNPFNPSTTIRFTVPVRSRVDLAVFNLLGQRIADLAHEDMGAGSYERTWNAGVASGVYFCRMEAVSVDDPGRRFVTVKKMMLLK
jgi:hypothetical protein